MKWSASECCSIVGPKRSIALLPMTFWPWARQLESTVTGKSSWISSAISTSVGCLNWKNGIGVGRRKAGPHLTEDGLTDTVLKVQGACVAEFEKETVNELCAPQKLLKASLDRCGEFQHRRFQMTIRRLSGKGSIRSATSDAMFVGNYVTFENMVDWEVILRKWKSVSTQIDQTRGLDNPKTGGQIKTLALPPTASAWTDLHKIHETGKKRWGECYKKWGASRVLDSPIA